MATAVENTIPCDRCHGQVNLDDWSRHIKFCVSDRNRQQETNNSRRNLDDESNNVRIPCEYCEALISGNDWSTHTINCAEEYRQRTERLRNDISKQPIDTSIPCEYCNESISIHDFERHTRQCAEDRRHRDRDVRKDNVVLIPCERCNNPIDQHDWGKHMNQCTNSPKNDRTTTENDQPVLIPCEYCNMPVAAHEWDRHTKKCAEAEKKRLAEKAKRISKESSNAMIPCEYCSQPFSEQKLNAHERKCRNGPIGATRDTPSNQVPGDRAAPTDRWNGSATTNLTRYTVDRGTDEYRFVEEKFRKTLPTNPIERVERIQNRRWFRQYEAHKDDFTERYNESTEQWLFHGMRKAESAEAIIRDCFNRSHAVNCAHGQGIYFATDAALSYQYTQADAQGFRHMFLARVLVGRTTRGNRTTRVCPPGYDTTGGGNIFVAYHDAQAYAQYLIIFR